MAKKKLTRLEKDLPDELNKNLYKEELESLKLELRSVQSALSIKYFRDKKQETLLLCLIKGIPYEKSLYAAGYNANSKDEAEKFLASRDVSKIIYYFKEKNENALNITRQNLSEMALDCYKERSSSSEGIRVIEVLSRLWGLNKESNASRITINNQQNVDINEKEHERYMKNLTTDELKKMASNNLKTINIEEEDSSNE